MSEQPEDLIQIELCRVKDQVEFLKNLEDFDFGIKIPETIKVIKYLVKESCIIALYRMGESSKNKIGLGKNGLNDQKIWRKFQIARNSVIGHNGINFLSDDKPRYKTEGDTTTIDFSAVANINTKDIMMLLEQFEVLFDARLEENGSNCGMPIISIDPYPTIALNELTTIIKKSMLYDKGFVKSNNDYIDISEQGHDYDSFLKHITES